MIKLENVCGGYGKKEIIHKADVLFEENKITAVVGPNGCGKTTLLKLVSGVMNTKSGNIIVDGKNIKDYKRNELAKKISFMPQIRYTPDMSVENLIMCARYPYMGISQIAAEDDYQAVKSAISLTGLEDYADKSVRKLSGGECQKVYFAMMLAQQTKIMVLDEPTTYLDMDKQYEFLNLMKKMKNQKTIIMVLHDLTMALKYADNIIVMDKGRIVGSNTVKETIELKVLDKVYDVKIKEVVVDERKEYIITNG